MLRARGIVHGDFYRGNLLVDDGFIVGLIDWDEARVDDYVTEFAWSIVGVREGAGRHRAC